MTVSLVATSARDLGDDSRDTVGMGFKGWGKSAGDLSQQLAQSSSVASSGYIDTAILDSDCSVTDSAHDLCGDDKDTSGVGFNELGPSAGIYHSSWHRGLL